MENLKNQKVYLPVNVEDELLEESGFYKTEEEVDDFLNKHKYLYIDYTILKE